MTRYNCFEVGLCHRIPIKNRFLRHRGRGHHEILFVNSRRCENLFGITFGDNGSLSFEGSFGLRPRVRVMVDVVNGDLVNDECVWVLNFSAFLRSGKKNQITISKRKSKEDTGVSKRSKLRLDDP